MPRQASSPDNIAAPPKHQQNFPHLKGQADLDMKVNSSYYMIKQVDNTCDKDFVGLDTCPLLLQR